MAQKNKTKNIALQLCVTAMFSALLVAGKQALATIPNVEIVTILIAVCAYVWGLNVVLPAVFAFIAVDVAIWGINTWVISYVVHWNAVALVFWALSKIKLKNKVLQAVFATITAVLLTTLFGVLTSVIDTAIGFVGGRGFYVDFENFGKRFVAMYVAGVAFFVTHIVSNGIVFALSFAPLEFLNRKVKLRMFPIDNTPQAEINHQ